MCETLRSVGLDVGTTTTQLIVSELTVKNRSSGFAVPEMEIADRQILYKSPVYFTPLTDNSRVDGAKIREIVENEYQKAGISRETVDTGAIIITGETSRKENARTVLEALSTLAGEFVVATAGPDLESILAAKGAGAADYSQKTGKTVLHMDIGGGTSNLALIREGVIVSTGCLNVGGRLLKWDKTGSLTYISPVLTGLTTLKIGQRPTRGEIEEIAASLAQGLEMAAGLRTPTELLCKLETKEAAGRISIPEETVVISFSGGVADCIGKEFPEDAFGDMGPALGQAIRKSRLCAAEYILGQETIRATVIGAGCHSARLSGSTVLHKDVTLPMKNLPVAVFTAGEQEREDLPQLIREKVRALDTQTAVLAFPGYSAASYTQVRSLAEKLAQSAKGCPLYVCLEGDMAKALGHCLLLHLPPSTPLLCIDRLRLQEGSFLDVGLPVGPALPVVIKTLVLSEREKKEG